MIGAAVSVALVRSGFLGFLFLLPIGVVAYCFSPRYARICAVLVILGNTAFTLFTGSGGYNPRELWADILYLTALTTAFTWHAAPPARGPAFFRMPTVYRLIAGSVIGALAFALVIYTARDDWGFYALIREQAEALASLYAGASGADVVQQSLSAQYMTADIILETLRVVGLRGGILVSCMLLFFVSRQISLLITWLVRHKPVVNSAVGFHVRAECIWVLSFALLSILVGMRFGIAPLEIVAWNVLVICAILYMAQGVGIALFFFARIMSPALRIFLNLAILVMIFSPGINAVALGVLILLGIAENWVPFRAPKTNGPSSTPGMGE
ncbi:putative membrane protein [Treponema primitia ZAS-2]|uniref:Putative membrane protein n=1 Tax=Treponema primitia (strain ATCC BAA-887 / DSM 12427 / ZAS-2) TaxID=545694 RepID=F5YR54_TREPZ|nr:putative membrane protein [Treponema primitia ZAS-2]